MSLRLAFNATLLSAALITSGCGFYLHNPATAAATADLEAKADKMTAPAYFNAQEQNLAELAGREDHALAGLLTASRDYRLLNVLRPATASESHKSEAQRLRDLIAEDLSASFGQPYLDTGAVRLLTTSPFVRATAQRELDFKRGRVTTVAGQYKNAGGTLPTKCEAVLANPGAVHSDPRQASRYRRLIQACTDLGGADQSLKDCSLGAARGDLLTICTEAAGLADDPAVAKRKADIEAAEKALGEAIKAANAAGDNEAVTAAQAALERAQALPTDEAVGEILTQLEKIFGERLGASLKELSAGASESAAEVVPPLQSALAAIGAVYEYRAARRASPAEMSSALLVGLAKVRHELKLVHIDIAAQRSERELAIRQAEALRSQLNYLAQAQDALCTGSRRCSIRGGALPFSEALAFYVRSQDVGRAPYEILSFRRLQLQRKTALEHAKATEADYRSLIQPAIDQLVAYGAGGTEIDKVVDLLTLPVIAARP